MQITKTILLLATCATTALSVAVPDTAAAAAAEECSNLGLGGVMSVKSGELPEGVSASDVRKCIEHPHGRERFLGEASLAPLTKKNSTLVESLPLEGRDALKCQYAAPYGCSKGYCWKSCGNNGEWCWTANKAGLGSWIGCETFSECGTTTYACGVGGLSGGCACS